MVAELSLLLCLAGRPAQVPAIAAWLRGSGRREWVRYQRCDDRRNWCSCLGVRRDG